MTRKKGKIMKNIIEIKDLSIPELKMYSCTNEKQLFRWNEPDYGIFIAESPKVIRRALDAGYTPFSILAERKYITGQAADIIETCGNIPVYTADSSVLTKITGFNLTQGVLCAMKRRQLPSVSEICSGTLRIAVLEDIMNQTNIGAVFRSAAALGIDAIILTKGCSDPLYRRSIRVSMGTVFQIPWTFTEKSDSDYILKLKDMGFSTAAMALTDDSVGIDNNELMSQKRLAIVLGTEGEGLRQSTIDSSDYTVKIPMSHGVDSLNVAAASAVAFWQLGNH